MTNHRRLKSIGLMAVTALILFPGSSGVAAQGSSQGKGVVSHPFAARGSDTLPLWGTEMSRSGSVAQAGAGLSARRVIVEMPMESGYSSRLASPWFPNAEDVANSKEEPRALALPAVEADAALTFLSERERYWQPRPNSAIPPGTNSGMFPGSRLRGPFEQTYPRPFPGGGQP
jgi:hypothetical protein